MTDPRNDDAPETEGVEPTTADEVAHPEQPPMDDASGQTEAEEEAAKLGDFA